MTESHPVPASAKELTTKEAAEHLSAAFQLEREIKGAAVHVNEAWWELSEKLHKFHEAGYWGILGYETLEEFLQQPELGIKRSTFFQMTKMWRDLVEVKKIAPKVLKELEPSKVREVAPAIMRGEVKPEDALDDAETSLERDVKQKYRPTERGKQKPDDSAPLAAEDEPDPRDVTSTASIQCEHCGSWYVPDATEE